MSSSKRSSNGDEGKAPRKRSRNWSTIDSAEEEKDGGGGGNLEQSKSSHIAPLLAELYRVFVSGALSPELTTSVGVELSALLEVLRPCSGCTTITKCNGGTGPCRNCSTKKKRVCSVPTFLRYWVYSKRTGLTLEQTLFIISNYCDPKTKKTFSLDSTIFNNHLRRVTENNLLPPRIDIGGVSVLGDSPLDLEIRVKSFNLSRSPVIRLPARPTHNEEQSNWCVSKDLSVQAQSSSYSQSSSLAQSTRATFRNHTEFISPILSDTPFRVIQAADTPRHFQTPTPMSLLENTSSPPYTSSAATKFLESAVQSETRLEQGDSTSPFVIPSSPPSSEDVLPLYSLEENVPPVPTLSISDKTMGVPTLSFERDSAAALNAETSVSGLEQHLARARERSQVQHSGVKSHDRIRQENVQTFEDTLREAQTSIDTFRQKLQKELVMLSQTSEDQMKNYRHHVAGKEDIHNEVLSIESRDLRTRGARNEKLQGSYAQRESIEEKSKEISGERDDAYDNKVMELYRQQSLEGSVGESCEQRISREAKLVESRSRYEIIEGKLQESNARCETLEDKLKGSNTRCEILENKVTELNTRCETLESRLKKSNARYEILEGQLKESNTLYETLECRSKESQEELAGQAQAINTLNEHIQEQQVTLLKLKQFGITFDHSEAEKRPESNGLDKPDALIHKLITVSNYSRRLGLLDSTDVVDLILHQIKGPLESIIGIISQAPDFAGRADIQHQLELTMKTQFAIICRLETALKYVAHNTEYRSQDARKIMEAYASINEGQLLSISQHLLVKPCSENAIEKPIFREPLEGYTDISDPTSRSGLVPAVVHKGVSGRRWYHSMVALLQRTLDNVDVVSNKC
ncbi:hypothetical protein F5877DRAFT_78080 [Lentinula edodes]|nr:hypothetical protein F5877DRAFT_78080 [Lentinula edodes]